MVDFQPIKNVEKHRNYISFHRNDDSYTALYAKTEDLFVKIAYGKDESKEKVFKLPGVEKNILDNKLPREYEPHVLLKGSKKVIIELDEMID